MMAVARADVKYRNPSPCSGADVVRLSVLALRTRNLKCFDTLVCHAVAPEVVAGSIKQDVRERWQHNPLTLRDRNLWG